MIAPHLWALARPRVAVGRGIPHPIGVELRYARSLRAILRASDEEIRAAVRAEAAQWVAAWQRETGIHSDESLRRDAATWREAITALFDVLAERMRRRMATEGAEAVAAAATATQSQNAASWRREIRRAYGVDVLAAEPGLRSQLEAWEAENLSLITRMGSDRIDRIRGLVLENVAAGYTSARIEAELAEQLGVGTGRARLIAQDQVSKLNANMTMIRQRAAGVAEYEWSTSRDERVRPTHKANQGKRFRWDRPPSSTGHPGHDIRCRCVALPVFPDFDAALAEAGLSDEGD